VGWRRILNAAGSLSEESAVTDFGLDIGHRFVRTMSSTLGEEWCGKYVGWSG
jgi:hypothetical protein